jgi:hypothetical protein
MSNVNPATGYIDRSRAQQLVEKWAPVLNYSSDKVAPIEDEHARLTTAILMENQERWCIEENGNTAGAGGSLRYRRSTLTKGINTYGSSYVP